ncbi:hypothetical protein C8Q80DRAFT_1275213 [Daedaleopsis nitida]|nr:hypothetical protein C8Q80DRAFT_1275213 [Daedaleopsis nitida]
MTDATLQLAKRLLAALQGELIPTPTEENTLMTCFLLDRTLWQALTLVRNVTNANVAINRLPIELLRHIFHYVPSSLRKAVSDRLLIWPSEYLHAADLDPITQVCHHWRVVALDDPTLWTGLHTTSPPARSRISRAARLPLSLICDTYGDTLKETLGYVTTRELPLLELHITANHELTVEQFQSLRTDRLRQLTISGATYDMDIAFLSGKTSQSDLKYLTLFRLDCLPRIQAPVLTHLLVSLPTSTCQWGLHDLLVFLSQCPLLSELLVSNSYMGWDTGPLQILPSVSTVPRCSLPKLTKFGVHTIAEDFDHFWHAKWLLSLMELPRVVAYSICGKVPSSFDAYYFEPDGADEQNDGLLKAITIPVPPTIHISRILIRAPHSYSEDPFPASVVGTSLSGASVRFCTEYLERHGHDTNEPQFWYPMHCLPAVMSSYVNSVIVEEELEVWVQALPYDPDNPEADPEDPEWVSYHLPTARTLVVLCSPFWTPDKLFRTLQPASSHGAVAFSKLHTLRLHSDLFALPNSNDLLGIIAARASRGYRLDRVLIEYTPPTRDETLPGAKSLVETGLHNIEILAAGLREHVNGAVEVRKVDRPPSMKVPEICNRDSNDYWPPWTSSRRAEDRRKYHDFEM